MKWSPTCSPPLSSAWICGPTWKQLTPFFYPNVAFLDSPCPYPGPIKDLAGRATQAAERQAEKQLGIGDYGQMQPTSDGAAWRGAWSETAGLQGKDHLPIPFPASLSAESRPVLNKVFRMHRLSNSSYDLILPGHWSRTQVPRGQGLPP